jgi:hypothetical protein
MGVSREGARTHRYTAFVGYEGGPLGAYRYLEEVIEASDTREAARRAFELAGLHPDEEFPELLIVPEDQVHIFTRDDEGAAVTFEEDLPRLLRKGPKASLGHL